MRQSRAVLLAVLLVSAVLLLLDTHGRPSQIASDIRDTIADLHGE